MNQRIHLHLRCWILVCIAISAEFAFAGEVMGASSSEKLQTLTNETSAQISLAYRQHPSERELRRQQLAEVVKSWRTAEHNEANNDRLANWLRAAMANSMPGSQDPLPPLPAFTSIVKVHEPQLASEPAVKTAPAEDSKTEADPFRDDPVIQGK
jgi:hypothetical protein